MSNKCIFCDMELKATINTLNGIFYNCEKHGKFHINDDDMGYFTSISTSEEKEWYATELQNTKRPKDAPTIDLQMLMCKRLEQ